MSANVIPFPARVNEFERANRIRKALAIADALDGFNFTSHEVMGFSSRQWNMAAEGAKVAQPSQLTKAAVVNMLVARERIRGTAKNCGRPDA